jgi:Flp pilus assembly pilin Flp
MSRRADDGATAVEYAILLAGVAAVVVAGVGVLGLEVLASFADMVAAWP